MIANALLATCVLSLAAIFGLMQACRFLIPYRDLLLHAYGPTLAVWASVSFVNLFAARYSITRVLFLKDTGQKLAHMEKQLHGGSLLAELAQRLED